MNVWEVQVGIRAWGKGLGLLPGNGKSHGKGQAENERTLRLCRDLQSLGFCV